MLYEAQEVMHSAIRTIIRTRSKILERLAFAAYEGGSIPGCSGAAPGFAAVTGRPQIVWTVERIEVAPAVGKECDCIRNQGTGNVAAGKSAGCVVITLNVQRIFTGDRQSVGIAIIVSTQIDARTIDQLYRPPEKDRLVKSGDGG